MIHVLLNLLEDYQKCGTTLECYTLKTYVSMHNLPFKARCPSIFIFGLQKINTHPQKLQVTNWTKASICILLFDATHLSKFFTGGLPKMWNSPHKLLALTKREIPEPMEYTVLGTRLDFAFSVLIVS